MDGDQGIPINIGFTNSNNDFIDKDFIQTVFANVISNTPDDRKYNGKPYFVLDPANRGLYFMNITKDGLEKFGLSVAGAIEGEVQLRSASGFDLDSSASFVFINDSLGVGTSTPNINSVIDIVSTTKGLLKPRMSTLQRTALGVLLANIDADKGMEVYDLDTLSAWSWDGTQWVAAGAGGGATLEERIMFDSNLDTIRDVYYNGVLTFGSFNIDTVRIATLEFETSTDGISWTSHGTIAASGTPPAALNSWVSSNGSGNWYLRLSAVYNAAQTLPTGTQWTLTR